jgi:cation transport ATPase
VALKAVPGVDSVDVSLNKGSASVKMKPGNTTTFKELQDAITKNGFTTKQSQVVIRGDVIQDGATYKLKVSGSNEQYALIGANPSGFVGKAVVVEGTIPERAKGKTADSIQVKSVNADSEKR